MSREHKYRAWDKNKKRMYDEVIVGDHLILRAVTALSNESYVDVDYLNGDGTNVVAMEYTGLTDKNGKEIYEGDIVKLPHWTGAVGWDKGGYRFDPISYMACYSESTHEQLKSIEVIGNIYENPELLENKK